MSNSAKTLGSSSSRARGRPRKFGEPARPVTVTLPESTIAMLQHIDRDFATAIVKIMRAAQAKVTDASLVEVVEMAEHTGLIVIGPSTALQRIPFLHLVEVGPGRYLLALDPGQDFRSLELAIQDVLDDGDIGSERERVMIAALIHQIRRMRKASQVRMAEILLVRLSATAST